MPFPDYSSNGGGERFIGTVESAIEQKAATGAPLTSQNLQDIGRTIDDEIAKVQPKTPTENHPIDTVEVQGYSIGDCLTIGAGNRMINYTSQASTYDLLSAYKSGYFRSIYIPILVAKSTDGTAEVIRVASVTSEYAKATGVNRYGWYSVPSGDDFEKWLSSVQATQLPIKKAQFTGDGRTLAITMYDTDTRSENPYGDRNGLYQIFLHGSLDGDPYYDADSKCWVGRDFNIDEALIVYTNPTNGKQYVTKIKN